MIHLRLFGICSALVLLVATPAQSQVLVPPPQGSTTGPYTRIAVPGEATVQVMVMGVEVNAGLYEIGESIELDELLVLTGGGTYDPKTYKTTIYVYRQAGGERTVIYEEPIQRVLIDNSTYPQFQNGDILLVERILRNRYTLFEVARTVSSATSLILLAIRIAEFF